MVVMAEFPRCAALLRDGTLCGRTVAAASDFCVHHTKLLATTDAETMRQGRTPKPRATKKQTLRVVTEPAIDVMMTTTETDASGLATTKTMARSNDHANTMTNTIAANADPTTVRPLFAAAAAENVDQLTAALLEAAGSAVKPVWLTVECATCGERSRIEAPVPDVRARVAAIELLLREGLGRPATADEVPSHGCRRPWLP
jgi:hypothetical protein